MRSVCYSRISLKLRPSFLESQEQIGGFPHRQAMEEVVKVILEEIKGVLRERISERTREQSDGDLFSRAMREIFEVVRSFPEENVVEAGKVILILQDRFSEGGEILELRKRSETARRPQNN